MKPKDVAKLKKGTPIKVIYRKFPYIVKYVNWESDVVFSTENSVYVTFHAVDETGMVKARYVHAIDNVTEFKS